MLSGKGPVDLLLAVGFEKDSETISESMKSFNLIYKMNLSHHNNNIDFIRIRIVYDELGISRNQSNKSYGYYTTDILVNYMISSNKCTWLMLSNGDNMYNSVKTIIVLNNYLV